MSSTRDIEDKTLFDQHEMVTIKSLEDLVKNKSKSIYYCMEKYNADSLSGIQKIQFCDKIKLCEPLPSSIESITSQHIRLGCLLRAHVLPSHKPVINVRLEKPKVRYSSIKTHFARTARISDAGRRRKNTKGEIC